MTGSNNRRAPGDADTTAPMARGDGRMARRYPRIGTGGGNINRSAACKACSAWEPVSPVAVQVNWFRGDDDVHPVCKTCKRLPSDELLRRLGYRCRAAAAAPDSAGSEAADGK